MTQATQAAKRNYLRPPVAKPYPGRTEPLAASRDGVTPEWLTRLLQNRYPGVVVQNYTVTQLLDSHTTKMRIQWDLNEAGKAAGLPRNVCLKSNWSGGFNDVDICALEAQFYYYLADRMKAKVHLANCFYADWDEEGHGGNVGEGIVILEDLTERGGRFGNSRDEIGIDGLAKAFESVAKMHGSLWGDPYLDEQKWLPYSMETPVDNDQIRIMWSWIEMNLGEPEFCKMLPRRFLDNPDILQQAYDAVIRKENDYKGPRCLNLGDCHQGNTYILPDNERLFLDWQLVRKGTPWRDITYFMIGALTVEERRKAERDLLAHYRQALVATGAEGVPSLDEIFTLYRGWVVYGMQAWVANRDEWGQPGKEMNKRFFTAGEDLDTWTLLLG